MNDILKKLLNGIAVLEARIVLAKYKPKIIAIVGNVGKTVTADATEAILRDFVTVTKTDDRADAMASVYGAILQFPRPLHSLVATTRYCLKALSLILFRKQYPEWLILEMHVERPGDMQRYAEWICPDIIVVTRFPKVPTHIEYFDSADHLYREKTVLLRNLKKDGVLILNADDPQVTTLTQFPHAHLLTFGMSEAATVSVHSHEYTYTQNTPKTPKGSTFTFTYKGSDAPSAMPGVIGHHLATAYAAAIAVAIALKIRFRDAVNALEMPHPSRGRMRVHHGIRDTVILDDSYSSAPLTLKEALVTLRDIETKHRRIAVLGDMLELGEFSPEAHKKAGVFVASIADVLITVGVRSRGMAQSAREAGMNSKYIYEYLDAREAGAFLKKLLEPSDVVLVKGSPQTRTERIVGMLLVQPESARDVLVRQ